MVKDREIVNSPNVYRRRISLSSPYGRRFLGITSGQGAKGRISCSLSVAFWPKPEQLVQNAVLIRGWRRLSCERPRKSGFGIPQFLLKL